MQLVVVVVVVVVVEARCFWAATHMILTSN